MFNVLILIFISYMLFIILILFIYVQNFPYLISSD